MSNRDTLPFQRAIITGAAGFLGAALVDRLAPRITKVVALDALPPRRALPGGVDFIQTDLTDDAVLERTFAGVGSGEDWRDCRVFHLAAESHVGRCRENPLRAHTINVTLTLRVLEAARRAGITHVVYPSTALLYKTPRPAIIDEAHPVAASSISAATSLAAENLVAGYASEFSFTCAIARLGNIYGPDGHADSVAAILLRQARQREPLALRRLSPIRDFIFRDDVCDGLIAMACLKEPGLQVINLATGKGTSIRELALTMCRIAGLPSAVHETDATSANEQDHLVLSVARAAEVCNWRPTYSLEMGLREALG